MADKNKADKIVGYTKFFLVRKNKITHTKTTIILAITVASAKSPAGKTTTLEIKAAKVE